MWNKQLRIVYPRIVYSTEDLLTFQAEVKTILSPLEHVPGRWNNLMIQFQGLLFCQDYVWALHHHEEHFNVPSSYEYRLGDKKPLRRFLSKL